MQVVLVHHGEAVGPDVDPQRPLTTRGVARVEELAAAVAAQGIKPVAIWHSGKLRARQTAEAFWRQCNPLAEFRAVRGLQPADSVEWIRNVLLGEQRDVLVVGHMPQMPALLQALVAASPDGPPSFPPHGVVVLEMAPDGAAVERWRMPAPQAL